MPDCTGAADQCFLNILVYHGKELCRGIDNANLCCLIERAAPLPQTMEFVFIHRSSSQPFVLVSDV